jgi:hypothetical protein
MSLDVLQPVDDVPNAWELYDPATALKAYNNNNNGEGRDHELSRASVAGSLSNPLRDQRVSARPGRSLACVL